MDREIIKESIINFLNLWQSKDIRSKHLRLGQTFIIMFGKWFPDYQGPLFTLEDETESTAIIMGLLESLDKDNAQDFSKVQRYDMVRFYEDSWRSMGEDPCGYYVLYNDYKKLLDVKLPPRLPASFKDVCGILSKEIKSLEKQSYSVFERKNETNYGYAVSKYKEAQDLRRVKTLLEKKTFTNE
jgi:hypothetical protein